MLPRTAQPPDVPRATLLAAGTALAVSLALGGCSSDSGGLSTGALGIGGGMTAGYTAANAILPVGYSEEQVDETHWRVRAHGTETTTRDRLEKIATARAAEIGSNNHMPYFQITGMADSITCGKEKKGYKTNNTPAVIHPLLTVDVTYSKSPMPGTRPSADTFSQLKTELDTDNSTPEAKAAATQDAKTRCGVT